jgi:hypothetical protein
MHPPRRPFAYSGATFAGARASLTRVHGIKMVVDFFLGLLYYPETAGISLERIQNHLVVDEPERQL